MSNVRLTWNLPTVSSVLQRPIQSTEISVRVDTSFPWTVQDNVDPSSAQELLLVDVAPGTYYYQGVVVDVDGVRGSPVETSIDIPFEAPGSITNFTATLE